MRPLSRMQPALPAAAMKTYTVSTPLATHFEFASCAQVDCPAYLLGWTTTIDETDEQGRARAHYIRRLSGRGCSEHRDERGLTVFTFPAGQRCFLAPPLKAVGRPVLTVLAQLRDPRLADRWHRRKVDRPPLFLVRDGDWRGNPRATSPITFKHGRQWVDDFGEHQERLAARLGKR